LTREEKPMRTACRRHPATDVLPRFLLCPEDALDVLCAVQDERPDAKHVALVVDRDRRGLLAMPVTAEGDDLCPTIEHVTEVLLTALADSPDGPMGLVLCTIRPGQGIEDTPADAEAWRDLKARCQADGVELLDWFLFDYPYSRSMAETCDEGWAEPPGMVE
jgi:hypothetical protein